jgi:hypothetical protein
MKTLRQKSQLLYFGLIAGFLFAFAAPSKAQITNFVDDFNGPDLNTNAWITLQGTAGDLTGFNGLGQYVVQCQTSAGDSGLRYPMNTGGVTNSWTADCTVELPNFSGTDTDFKFRFFAPQFIEINYNSQGTLRVYSGELSKNITVLNGIDTGGQPLNLRLTYDGTSGNLNVGYSIGANQPYTLFASATGLKQFNANSSDIVLTKWGTSTTTAVVQIDHFDITNGVLPISIPTFTDHFAGPTLDPSWNVIGPGANQVGFTNGAYVVQTPSNGSSGLGHALGGSGSFTANLTVVLTNFIGAGTDFQFLFPSAGGDIFFDVTPTGDLYVYSEELAQNVGSFPGFGLKDGDVLSVTLAYDAINDIVDVGVSQNAGPMIRLAEVTGLTSFSPSGANIVLNRSSAGNGNNPWMELQYFQIVEGFQPVAASSFSDNFNGPALDPTWTQLGPSANQIGFNGVGQYVVQAASTTTNGLSRRIGFNGDFTANLSVQLTNFLGSGAVFQYRVPGAGGVEIDYSSSDDLSVYSDGVQVADYGAMHFTEGSTLNLRIAYFSAANQIDFGASLNNASMTQVASFGGGALIPTVNDMVLIQQGAGNGKTALMELDSYAILPAYNAIPVGLPPFTEEFTGPSLDPSWATTDVPPGKGGPGALVGFNGLGQYEIKNWTNVDVDIIRALGTSGGPYGSFTVDLTAEFPTFLNTGTDLKLRMLFYPGIYIVINQFGIRADVDSPTGGHAIPTTVIPGMTNGDTVNIRFVYNNANGTAALGYTRNNGNRVIVGQITGLSNFSPTYTDIDTYKWGSGPTQDVLLDHFAISPDVLPLAGPLAIHAASGQKTLTWTGGGILQSAPTVSGPWTDVSGATSPYSVPTAAGSLFFRARE